MNKSALQTYRQATWYSLNQLQNSLPNHNLQNTTPLYCVSQPNGSVCIVPAAAAALTAQSTALKRLTGKHLHTHHLAAALKSTVQHTSWNCHHQARCHTCVHVVSMPPGVWMSSMPLSLNLTARYACTSLKGSGSAPRCAVLRWRLITPVMWLAKPVSRCLRPPCSACSRLRGGRRICGGMQCARCSKVHCICTASGVCQDEPMPRRAEAVCDRPCC